MRKPYFSLTGRMRPTRGPNRGPGPLVIPPCVGTAATAQVFAPVHRSRPSVRLAKVGFAIQTAGCGAHDGVLVPFYTTLQTTFPPPPFQMRVCVCRARSLPLFFPRRADPSSSLRDGHAMRVTIMHTGNRTHCNPGHTTRTTHRMFVCDVGHDLKAAYSTTHDP